MAIAPFPPHVLVGQLFRHNFHLGLWRIVSVNRANRECVLLMVDEIDCCQPRDTAIPNMRHEFLSESGELSPGWSRERL